MTTTTTTDQAPTLTACDRALAAGCLADLTKAYARHINWQSACRWYSAAKDADLNPDAPKGMPSKAAKHRMYGEAGRLMSILKLTQERPHTLAEVGALISQALDIL